MTGRTFTDLNDPGWERLFLDVQKSWFRLETLQAYDVEYEAEEFANFQRSGTVDTQPGPWQHMIADHVRQGRRLQRVHVVTDPLTDYIRYELAVYARNALAGEEVRLISLTDRYWPEEIPEHGDFWLFDDQELWIMRYDSTGRFQAAEELTEPSAVEAARSTRDWAMDHSLPLADYRPRAD